MKKRALLLGMMLTLAVTSVGCGKKEADANITEPIYEESSEEAVVGDVVDNEEEEDLPDGKVRNELTGELIDESLANQRPIAVMVDNESIALPHYGLTQADVVYEMMNSTENGRITRFMALVKDWETLEQFGSIRSARVTNCILAAEWNAVLCHDGGPFYIDEYIALPSVDDLMADFPVSIMENPENIQSTLFQVIWTKNLQAQVQAKSIINIIQKITLNSPKKTLILRMEHLQLQ